MSHGKYERLIARAKAFEAVPTAVAHPCDESSLSGATDAAKLGLIRPILVGPKARIEATAKQFNLDISGFELVDAPYSEAAAAAAVELVRAGRAEALMKGQPAYRRTDECGREARYGFAHCAPHQPLLRHGRALTARSRC